MRVFVVLRLVFSTPIQEIGLGKRLYLCREGRKTTTQSVIAEGPAP